MLFSETKCVSPPLANQLALFSRELVDLLKTAPHCQLPFNRFIPAYHHHFGRQCRVADYGFTKLIDLLEALTHTVQVCKLDNAISQTDVNSELSANHCVILLGDGRRQQACGHAIAPCSSAPVHLGFTASIEVESEQTSSTFRISYCL